MCILCLLLASTGWVLGACVNETETGRARAPIFQPNLRLLTCNPWMRILSCTCFLRNNCGKVAEVPGDEWGSSLVLGAAGSAASFALSCWCLPVLRLKFTRGYFLLRSFGSRILIHRCCSGPWSLGILPFSFPNVLHTWTLRNSFIPKILSPS